jgi:hypothetical protein
MKIIPAATVVKLTPEERQILEALAGSRKAEARIHDRAWIGLLTSASMAPPTNAVVLSVDEKPSIQALERAQGYLKLPNGRAMIGQSHDCKRNGPSALFAALNVGTGHVIAKHYKRRRRLEFRDFMNRVVKQYEGKEIHVILDHLSTHKPKRDLWLARHPNVMSEPDRNLVLDPGGPVVERSLVRQRCPTGGSQRKLINSYNGDARPFVWTKSAVHQKRLKPCFAV